MAKGEVAEGEASEGGSNPLGGGSFWGPKGGT